MTRLPKYERVVSTLTWVGLCGLIIMVTITVANVVGRIFGFPVPGTLEMIEFLGAITISAVLAYTTVMEGHVAVDLVVGRFPVKAQRAVGFLSGIIGSLMMLLIGYKTVIIGMRAWADGGKSDILKIPSTPILFFVALCFLITAMGFFVTGVRSLLGDDRK